MIMVPSLPGRFSLLMSAAFVIKRVIKIIGIVLLSLVFVLTAMIAIGEALKDESQLTPWGTGFFIVTSGSMRPEIPVGSLLLVAEVSEDDIREDDVITFFATAGNDIVTHRVREILSENGRKVFITRGDANNTDDPPLEYDRIIGRLLFVVPGSSSFTNTPLSAVYVGIGIMGFGLLMCIWGIISSIRKKADVSDDGVAGGNSDKNFTSDVSGSGDHSS